MTYRIVNLSGRYYASEVDLSNYVEEIEYFLESGDAVILCDELEELEFSFGIKIEDITIIVKGD